MLREAIARVKSAVSTKDIIPLYTHYVMKNGFIYAGNGRLTAATPFPVDEVAIVSAAAIDKVLQALPGDPEFTLTEKNVNFKVGKYKARVPRNATLGDGPTFELPKGKEVKIPDGFFTKIKALRPFVSDNATQQFALCFCFHGDYAMVTNNVVLAMAFEIGLGLEEDEKLTIPFYIFDYIAGQPEIPTGFIHNENSVAFTWEDGSWASAQLLSVSFPECRGMVINAPEPDFELTKEWKTAFDTISPLCDGVVKLGSEKMSGIRESAEIEAEVGTPCPDGVDSTLWSTDYLSPVIRVATHWKPDMWPKGSPFVSEHIAGMIIGRAQ